MNDPLPIVCGLDTRLTLAEKKALVMLVGMSTSPASDLAAAIGLGEDQLEAIWRETRRKRVEAERMDVSKPHLGVVA